MPKSRRVAACAIILASIAPSIAPAQDCQPVLLESFPLAASQTQLIVEDDVLYVASDDSQLVSYDVSEPRRPVELGRTASTFATEDIAIDGNYLYTTWAATGVQIYDISNPANMFVASTIASVEGSPLRAFGVDLLDDRMYVAAMDDGVLVFDVADPTDPIYLGRFEFVFGAYDVEATRWTINGEDRILVYVAYDFGDLAVVDLTDPTAGQLLTRRESGRQSWRVFADGDQLFVHGSGRLYGLNVFSLADPIRPLIRDSVNPPTQARQFELTGDLVLAASGSDGLVLVDVSESRCLKILFDGGRVPGVNYVAVASNRADDGSHIMYAARSQRVLEIWDISSCQPTLCRVDLNDDCLVTVIDFFRFQTAFADGEMLADFDGDGSLTVFDFVEFFNAYLAGCP